MKTKSNGRCRRATWLVIIAAAVLVVSDAHADMSWSSLGNMTNEQFLTTYVGLAGDDVNTMLDQWIDGWVDGAMSMYAYDTKLDKEGLTQLYICIYKRWPTASDVRKSLLAWGADSDMKGFATSHSIYLGIRYSCKHVLGEVVNSKTGETS